MRVKQLIRQLRGLINLGGGTSVEDVAGGDSVVTTPRVKRVKVGRQDVLEAIESGLDVSGGKGGVTVLPLDSHYWVPEEQTFHELMNLYRDEIGRNIYQGDAWDCEEYSIAMMNMFRNQHGINSVGFVFDGDSQHAYNVVVHSTTDGLRATLVEPNFFSLDGGEVDPTDSDGKYSVGTSTILL